MTPLRAAILGVAFIALLSTVPSAMGADATGRTTLTYRSRSMAGTGGSTSAVDRDMDFWARAEASSLLNGKADGRLTFRAFKDMDGTLPGEPLFQIGDTFPQRGDVRLYEGYFSLRSPAGLPGAVSLGRQYIPVGAGYAASFDGVSAKGKFVDNSVRIVLFGGERVSHYGTPDTEGVFGGGVAVTPWSGGVLELSDLKYTSHLWEAALAQRFPGERTAGARVTFVDSDPDSIRCSAHLGLPARFAIDAGYVRTMGKGTGRKDFPFDFTSRDGASSSRLLPGLPATYARYHVNLQKRPGSWLVIGAGGARRKLIHAEDEDEYNRSDWEGEGFAEALDFPVSGLKAFLRYRRVWEDRLNTPNGSTSVLTAGASYAATRDLSLGAELFANGEKRFVSETLLSEGASAMDRKERGEAFWASWTKKNVAAALRYERTRDDLYSFYGARDIRSVAMTVTAALGGRTR